MAVAMMIIIELESDFTMVDVSNNDNGATMTNLIGEENQIIFIAANTKPNTFFSGNVDAVFCSKLTTLGNQVRILTTTPDEA